VLALRTAHLTHVCCSRSRMSGDENVPNRWIATIGPSHRGGTKGRTCVKGEGASGARSLLEGDAVVPAPSAAVPPGCTAGRSSGDDGRVVSASAPLGEALDTADGVTTAAGPAPLAARVVNTGAVECRITSKTTRGVTATISAAPRRMLRLLNRLGAATSPHFASPATTPLAAVYHPRENRGNEAKG
jgi:hypothetical protein